MLAASSMPTPPNNPNSAKGLLGWLGRQVGYVAKAIKTNVTGTTVYRDARTEEHSLPSDPNIKLRRTVIDEVVVKPPPPPDQRK
jgi:hypothetical protein